MNNNAIILKGSFAANGVAAGQPAYLFEVDSPCNLICVGLKTTDGSNQSVNLFGLDAIDNVGYYTNALPNSVISNSNLQYGVNKFRKYAIVFNSISDISVCEIDIRLLSSNSITPDIINSIRLSNDSINQTLSIFNSNYQIGVKQREKQLLPSKDLTTYYIGNYLEFLIGMEISNDNAYPIYARLIGSDANDLNTTTKKPSPANSQIYVTRRVNAGEVLRDHLEKGYYVQQGLAGINYWYWMISQSYQNNITGFYNYDYAAVNVNIIEKHNYQF